MLSTVNLLLQVSACNCWIKYKHVLARVSYKLQLMIKKTLKVWHHSIDPVNRNQSQASTWMSNDEIEMQMRFKKLEVN